MELPDCKAMGNDNQSIYQKLLLHGSLLQSGDGFLFHTSDVRFRPYCWHMEEMPKQWQCDGVDGLFSLACRSLRW
nr:MAG TPA: hypothetical protein [Caudoviricetes sp.]